MLKSKSKYFYEHSVTQCQRVRTCQKNIFADNLVRLERNATTRTPGHTERQARRILHSLAGLQQAHELAQPRLVGHRLAVGQLPRASHLC